MEKICKIKETYCVLFKCSFKKHYTIRVLLGCVKNIKISLITYIGYDLLRISLLKIR